MNRDVERMIWAMIGNGTLVALALAPLSVKGLDVLLNMFR